MYLLTLSLPLIRSGDMIPCEKLLCLTVYYYVLGSTVTQRNRSLICCDIELTLRLGDSTSVAAVVWPQHPCCQVPKQQCLSGLLYK